MRSIVCDTAQWIFTSEDRNTHSLINFLLGWNLSSNDFILDAAEWSVKLVLIKTQSVPSVALCVTVPLLFVKTFPLHSQISECQNSSKLSWGLIDKGRIGYSKLS